ncbi:MAG TPA: hypothetical protein H9786_06510 [Candidatus Brachybacterium merdavium]|uniref:Uncharacterized protein n=1 Tax=Candidatus Brachybacterium merdavium TaxID=2838513 RepID=A0A9D2LCR5_9MICO|nr:hypothetical protein [Candidatus Brachybacterium merdavium]
MSLLWAARGRTWGFRFLRTAGHADPLPVYEDAFCGLDDQPEVCRRTGCQVALRLPDPEGRKDQSGRLIIHEFVIEGSAAQGVETPEDGRKRIWPLVAAEYAEVYDSPTAPPAGT